MPTLKVLKRHPYDKQMREVGETYECSEKHARVLIAIGKAEAGKKRGRPKKEDYERKDMVAE